MKYYRQIIFLALSLALLAYTAVRAANISIVYDESLTYFSFVTAPVKAVINYDFVTANNHVLNSILMKTMAEIFPVNQFTMRLPNLLAHVIFVFYSYKIAGRYKPFLLQLSLFVFLNVNPFLLDFFSLARGYGLSMGFTMASLYYFREFFLSRSYKLPVIAAMFFMAALAVLANFSLLNFYLPLLGVFVLVLIFFNHISLRGKMLGCAVALVITAALLAYVLPISFKLRDANELFFGGTTGFWQDTVNSLIQGYLYNRPYAETATIILQMLVVSALLAGLLLSALAFRVRNKEQRTKSGRDAKQPSNLPTLQPSNFSPYKQSAKNASTNNKSLENLVLPALLLLLLLCAASTITQFYLLGTKYLTERTALLFMPVFGIFVTEMFYCAYLLKKQLQIVVYIFCGLALLHFGFCINLTQVHIWKDSCKPMLADLETFIYKNKIDKPVSMQATWVYDGTIKFYKLTENISWLQDVKTIDTATYKQANFLYIDSPTLNSLDTTHLQRIKTYSQSNSYLFFNKRAIE